MSNGLIRSTGTPNKCLDAASSAANRPVLWDCDVAKNDQNWKIDAGRIMNVTTGGAQRRCVQGGPDGQPATMVSCSNAADQQWVSEGHVRAGAVGRLRTPGTNLCLETNAVQATTPLSVRGYSCAPSGRPQQRFVRLNGGQYRPVGNLGFCLDANGTADGTIPRTNPCTSPPGAVQQWVIDPVKGWLSSPSGSLCVEASGSGTLLRLRPCAIDGAGNPTNANQQWAFVPEAGL